MSQVVPGGIGTSGRGALTSSHYASRDVLVFTLNLDNSSGTPEWAVIFHSVHLALQRSQRLDSSSDTVYLQEAAVH